jgi:DNA-dependent RNA polymerase
VWFVPGRHHPFWFVHEELAAQIANLYGGGADKLSLDDRVRFVQERLDYVMDSAQDPIDGEHRCGLAAAKWDPSVLSCGQRLAGPCHPAFLRLASLLYALAAVT